MKKYAICGGELKKHSKKSEGILIKGWKCKKCSETFFPSSKMLRRGILTERRKQLTRKVRRVGTSKVVTLPKEIIASENIHENDLVLFGKIKQGILLKILRSH
jgi:hypothetical protein